MDKIKISKVENVTLHKRRIQASGTLHILTHHLIFEHRLTTPTDPQAPAKARAKEIWITYPMIASCVYRPMPVTLRQPHAIRLRCRDFTYVAFHFSDETQARSVYDSIKALTCGLGSYNKLYAFSYDPPPIEKTINGWQVYDARKEFRRMGISPKGADRGWRLSDINRDYDYSPTYPSLIVVPSSVSDNVLKHGREYRSRYRIPALTYLHPVNNCSITRSSQPKCGMFQDKRNPQDERLVAAIFSTSKPLPDAGMPILDDDGQLFDPDMQETPRSTTRPLPTAEDTVQNQPTDQMYGGNQPTDKTYGGNQSTDKIYGAQQKNFIVDARPQVNAVANQATGMGSENMEYYKDATKEYLGIANIHVMRDSLSKVAEAFAHTDYIENGPNQELLAKSKWLDYISLVLRGSSLVARQVGINHSHVLIHCSDGWDRTSQISALSQLCLDPYYRTLEGFIVLVEKDWVSFGHMFRHRSGFLSSEKWFEIENERVGGNRKADNPTANSGNGNAFGNALSTARGFFAKKNDSRESFDVNDAGDGTPSASSPSSKGSKHATTNVKETSPIFHQFLDATYQMLRQYPTRFEFNERFLRRLFYHLYSCQYGTFLFDSELQRVEEQAYDKTRSVWDYFLARREMFLNDQYDPTIDDKVTGKERIILPDTTQVKWWHELFGRTDSEMNGTPNAPTPSLPKEHRDPIVTGIENSEISIGPAANGSSITGQTASAFTNGAARLTAGLGSLSLGKNSASAPVSRVQSPSTNDSVPTRTIDEKMITTANNNESDTTANGRLSFSTFARDNAFRDT
ncbi:phosphatases II [Aureobasidium subglaciale]|nr:phosphatases II [Aureobasidium subglaciale]